MLNRSKVDMLLLAAATALTRLIFRSHGLYDLDSLGFALGVEHFDPRVYQPHPPGYFLYCCLGKVLHTVIPDVNLALVLLSILASCGAVVLIYQLALEWFGIRGARKRPEATTSASKGSPSTVPSGRADPTRLPNRIRSRTPKAAA